MSWTLADGEVAWPFALEQLRLDCIVKSQPGVRPQITVCSIILVSDLFHWRRNIRSGPSWSERTPFEVPVIYPRPAEIAALFRGTFSLSPWLHTPPTILSQVSASYSLAPSDSSLCLVCPKPVDMVVLQKLDQSKLKRSVSAHSRWWLLTRESGSRSPSWIWMTVCVWSLPRFSLSRTTGIHGLSQMYKCFIWRRLWEALMGKTSCANIT